MTLTLPGRALPPAWPALSGARPLASTRGMCFEWQDGWHNSWGRLAPALSTSSWKLLAGHGARGRAAKAVVGSLLRSDRLSLRTQLLLASCVASLRLAPAWLSPVLLPGVVTENSGENRPRKHLKTAKQSVPCYHCCHLATHLGEPALPSRQSAKSPALPGKERGAEPPWPPGEPSGGSRAPHPAVVSLLCPRPIRQAAS